MILEVELKIWRIGSCEGANLDLMLIMAIDLVIG